MKSNYKPLIVAVFLVIAGLGLKTWSSQGSGAVGVRHVFGGSSEAPSPLSSLAHSQVLIGVAEGAQVADSAALVENANIAAGVQLYASADDAAATIQDAGQPIGSPAENSQSVQYTVKKGDTLSTIAVHFKVSVASILSANPKISKKSLQTGVVITIPGAESPATPASSSALATLPNLDGDFIMPAQGYNEGVLQSDNSIEIENSCGTPVIAAANGVVVPDNNIMNAASDWNDGYGTFVLLEHPFGNEVFTRYAHLQQSLVGIGDYVKQGQEIGLIGQSGNASECSLSFQVIGAQNPFVK